LAYNVIVDPYPLAKHARGLPAPFTPSSGSEIQVGTHQKKDLSSLDAIGFPDVG
jgi:hypothetical protein